MLKLDFVVPVYNESEMLPAFMARLDVQANDIQMRFHLDVGYVFVDDGSFDNSFSVLCAYEFGTRRVRLLQLSRNFGKEAALSAGIAVAQESDAAILLDADLEHPPELAVSLIEMWLGGEADCIYAYKENRKADEGWLKDILSRLFFYLINKNARFHIPRNGGDFRLLNRPFMNALLSLPESERFMKGLYGWIGFRQKGIPFRAGKRVVGRSKFGWKNLLFMTMDALTSFSITPLRIMVISGLLISFVSAIYGLFILFERLLFNSVGPGGIASILVLMAFFGGVHTAFLGMLGEYMGKIILETKRRPTYIVAQERSFPET